MYLQKVRPTDSKYYNHKEVIMNEWTHEAILKRNKRGHSSKWHLLENLGRKEGKSYLSYSSL